MKTIEEMVAVMQAYADGKEVEVLSAFGNEAWVCCPLPTWDWESCDYRIKPEPKYRPYANAEECFADVKKHGGWIKHKEQGLYFFIDRIGNTILYCGGGMICDYEKIRDKYVWVDDGTPCGVLGEE